MRQRFSLVFFILAAAIGPAFAAAEPVNVAPLRPLPVLDNGRVKPFDTVARESVRFITGSESFGVVNDGVGEQIVSSRMDPVALALDWAAHSVEWQTRPLLYVPLLDLRAKLNMKPSQKWVSARALMQNTEFTAWVKGLEAQQMQAEQSHEKVFHATAKEERLDTAGIELGHRLRMFETAADLTLYPIIPTGPKSDQWAPLAYVLTASGADGDDVKSVKAAWEGLMNAYKIGDDTGFAVAANHLLYEVRLLAGPDYANTDRIDREVSYNRYKPFRIAWIVYLLAVVVLVAALMSRTKGVYVAAMTVFCVAILFHAGAFALRCSITGWAPVTNMYETVIWVAMMSAIFSLILELVYRKRVIAIGGAVVALLATVVADTMPPEMGGAIRNLTPVLRSNYWLTIHVLTIVSSYAAFALALVLGNIVLGQFIYGKSDPAVVRTNLLFTYRAVQIGVLLVAAGTILGGLWADVSWGRFWGWDPKEVWALIVLLTYLALLHGRFAGWIKQFGMAAGAVVCFTAVLMSWYGVNFVLGAGLHAYGFNTGGQGYVASFVAVQWLYVFIAWRFYRARHRTLASPEESSPGRESFPMGMPVTGK